MSVGARSARSDQDAGRGLGLVGCCAGAGILRITPLQGLIVTPTICESDSICQAHADQGGSSHSVSAPTYIESQSPTHRLTKR